MALKHRNKEWPDHFYSMGKHEMAWDTCNGCSQWPGKKIVGRRAEKYLKK